MTLPLTTDEVSEEVRALPEAQLSSLRQMACKDLFVMSKGVLGRKDVNKATHGQFCRFVDREKKLRRMGLMPRAHLKSTLATVDDSVRIVCDDPEGARILIAGETATLGEEFLGEIKSLWLGSPMLRLLFKHLVPTKTVGPGTDWSSTRASVLRVSTHKESHWTAIGVGGAITGFHFNRIKCDDLIGFEASQSPTTMAATIAWAKQIDSLLINQHVDIIDFIGTRWARNDLYSAVMKFYGQSLAVFTRQAIEDGQIIFPALHTWEEYERYQNENPDKWYAQYCNNPMASGQADFPNPQSCWLSPDGSKVVYRDDSGTEASWVIAEMDRVLTADPNSGSATAPDTAAISVQLISPKDQVFVVHSEGRRYSPSGFVDRIFEIAKRWKVRVVAIEKAGQQNTEHYFHKKQFEEGSFLRVIPLKPKNRNKEERIRTALEPIARSKRMYMLSGLTELRSQWDSFPAVDIIDQLDALAYGPEVWRKPMDMDTQEKDSRALKILLASRRRGRTGYG